MEPFDTSGFKDEEKEAAVDIVYESFINYFKSDGKNKIREMMIIIKK